MPTKCIIEDFTGNSKECTFHFKYNGKPLKNVKKEEGCDLTHVFIRLLDTLLRVENQNGSKELR